MTATQQPCEHFSNHTAEQGKERLGEEDRGKEGETGREKDLLRE